MYLVHNSKNHPRTQTLDKKWKLNIVIIYMGYGKKNNERVTQNGVIISESVPLSGLMTMMMIWNFLTILAIL